MNKLFLVSILLLATQVFADYIDPITGEIFIEGPDGSTMNLDTGEMFIEGPDGSTYNLDTGEFTFPGHDY